MSTLACNIDPPHHFDYVLLYFKMIRAFTQQIKGPISKAALKILLTAEQTATAYCKFFMADVIIKGVRPSILAATAVHQGIQAAK